MHETFQLSKCLYMDLDYNDLGPSSILVYFHGFLTSLPDSTLDLLLAKLSNYLHFKIKSKVLTIAYKTLSGSGPLIIF